MADILKLIPKSLHELFHHISKRFSFHAPLWFFRFKRNRHRNISCKQNRHNPISDGVNNKTKWGRTISEILFYQNMCFFSFLSLYSIVLKWPICKLEKCTQFLHMKYESQTWMFSLPIWDIHIIESLQVKATRSKGLNFNDKFNYSSCLNIDFPYDFH